ncbi:hypothetical protein ACQ4PT_041731 [Festuca glaucescens]
MAGKMDQTMIIVSGIVGSLGVLSAILGFSAEGTKLTLSDLLWGYGVCYYPQNPALALGVCAAIFLIIAQVVFAVVGGCCGCCKSRAMPSETNRIIGGVCAIVSWIAAVIAFALFVRGAASNETGARDATTLGLCYVLKDGIFAGAAVLTLAATALALTSYILLGRQPDTAAAAAGPKAQLPVGAAGIAMGQPQFPQQSPPQGYGQAPPPNYPQYSPPPQGTYGQAPNGQFPPPPAQGYGAHTTNPPPQVFGAHAPNQQFPPPAQGYGAQATNQQFPPTPPQRYGAHVPNQQYPPPAHGYAPSQQYPPPSPHTQQAPTPQGYEQVQEGPEVAAEVAEGEPDGGACTSEPVGDAEATQ